MTYEERIAAAQAKMQAFKEKMANAAEKAKAAHAMKKEEIAAAIAEINADLDAAIAEEFTEYDAVANEMIDSQIGTIKGDVEAAKENIRLAKERKDSKIYALKLKAQMKAEALKEKIADKRAERDKAAMECYILDLIDYAEYCQQIAFASAIEADLTLLEAAEVAAEYIEKYGEPEIEEAPEAEVAEAE